MPNVSGVNPKGGMISTLAGLGAQGEHGGEEVMSETDLTDIRRRARGGETLTDQEQGRLCLACVSTGDALWRGSHIKGIRGVMNVRG